MDKGDIRRMIAATACWCSLALFVSGGTGDPASAQPASSLIDLPATFTGDLQCAGCEPLRYHLDLLADGFFFLRTRYVSQTADGFDEIGRWMIDADGRTLELRGPHEPPAL